MIVECIDDTFYDSFGNGCISYPIKGNLYEVIDEQCFINIVFLILREFGNNNHWDKRQFREVDVNIEDATSKVLNELPIEVLI